MPLDNDTDEGFLMYVWLHSQTERALFSRQHVLRLLTLANVPEGQYSVSISSFIGVPFAVANPLLERARRQLKRQTPQLELPFKGNRGAEDFLL